MICQVLSMFLIIISSLISVAFITLFERKILGYMQFRLGPEKVGMKGILQPMSDAIKLYMKEMNMNKTSNLMLFFFSPCLSLVLATSLWISLPYMEMIISMKLSSMMFLCILGMGVYPILIAGWSSNSNYSMLGAMRALAQTISYEVSLIFIIMNMMFLSSSLSLKMMTITQISFEFWTLIVPTFMWMISVLAELNRTPFDFAEGESELVSGFNTEYSSGVFAIIFMAEYMMILFFSMLTTIMLKSMKEETIIYMPITLSFFFIWMRATLPRYRYDMLMYLLWKLILPLSLMYLFFSTMISTMF